MSQGLWLHLTSFVHQNSLPGEIMTRSTEPVSGFHFDSYSGLNETYWPTAEPAFQSGLQVQLANDVLFVDELCKLEVVSVKSTPRNMVSTIAEIAAELRYSSTTNTPAMSPLKSPPEPVHLPM
jgi:hypothetical protein